jgi:MFS family permease
MPSFFKAVMFMVPCTVYLLFAISVWRGRRLGPVGRARFAVIGFVILTALLGTILGGALGGLIFHFGPGRNCVAFDFLQIFSWILVGAALGFLLGIVSGAAVRNLAKTHRVAYFAPSVLLFLSASVSPAFLFNSTEPVSMDCSGDGSACELDCGPDFSCKCPDEAWCTFHFLGNANSKITCASGAACLLICPNGVEDRNCAFDICTNGAVQYCADGKTIVCGRSCPKE